MQHLAPTWQLVYQRCVKEVLKGYAPDNVVPPPLPIDQWSRQWSIRIVACFRPFISPKMGPEFHLSSLLPRGVRMKRLGYM